MQMCDPEATCRERWDWRANVARGIQLLQQKRNNALAYLNQHTVGGSYPNDKELEDSQVIQREAIQRYNGGSYWHWDSTSNVWKKTSPNSYVERVLNLPPEP